MMAKQSTVQSGAMQKTGRKYEFGKTILGIALLILLSGRYGTGFMMWIFALPVVPLLFWDAIEMLRAPQKRMILLAKALAWLAAFAAITASHLYRDANAREVADQIAVHIDHYQRSHGKYPMQLNDVDFNPDAPRSWGLVYRARKDEEPFLSYRSTWTMFDHHVYDFKRHRWEFMPD